MVLNGISDLISSGKARGRAFYFHNALIIISIFFRDKPDQLFEDMIIVPQAGDYIRQGKLSTVVQSKFLFTVAL